MPSRRRAARCGNGLTVTYTPFNKPATINRGTASIAFDHDPEHQRYSQLGANGLTYYIAGAGVLAERFAGAGGIIQWTNYLFAAGQLIGVHIERSDETVASRYIRLDHLGSISVTCSMRQPTVPQERHAVVALCLQKAVEKEGAAVAWDWVSELPALWACSPPA